MTTEWLFILPDHSAAPCPSTLLDNKTSLNKSPSCPAIKPPTYPYLSLSQAGMHTWTSGKKRERPEEIGEGEKGKYDKIGMKREEYLCPRSSLFMLHSPLMERKHWPH